MISGTPVQTQTPEYGREFMLSEEGRALVQAHIEQTRIENPEKFMPSLPARHKRATRQYRALQTVEQPKPAPSVIEVPSSSSTDTDFYKNREADGPWQNRAYCINEDPEKYFIHESITGAQKTAAIHAARLSCLKCVVKTDCLIEALGASDNGIWGGHTGEERTGIKQKNQVGLYSVLDNELLSKAITDMLKPKLRR